MIWAYHYFWKHPNGGLFHHALNTHWLDSSRETSVFPLRCDRGPCLCHGKRCHPKMMANEPIQSKWIGQFELNFQVMLDSFPFPQAPCTYPIEIPLPLVWQLSSASQVVTSQAEKGSLATEHVQIKSFGVDKKIKWEIHLAKWWDVLQKFTSSNFVENMENILPIPL